LQLIELQTNLLETLRALTEWGRNNTSPLDENTPHDLLVRAVNLIEVADDEARWAQVRAAHGMSEAENTEPQAEKARRITCSYAQADLAQIVATVRRDTLAGRVETRTTIGNLTYDEAKLYEIRLAQMPSRIASTIGVKSGSYYVYVTQ
jgi:hypothetical protein